MGNDTSSSKSSSGGDSSSSSFELEFVKDVLFDITSMSAIICAVEYIVIAEKEK